MSGNKFFSCVIVLKSDDPKLLRIRSLFLEYLEKKTKGITQDVATEPQDDGSEETLEEILERAMLAAAIHKDPSGANVVCPGSFTANAKLILEKLSKSQKKAFLEYVQETLPDLWVEK